MKQIIRIILFIFVALSFLFLTKALLLAIYQDFNYYYFASQAAFVHINPYLQGGPYTGYIYPPICLFFLYPFQLFPLVIASKLWIGFSLVSLIFALLIILRIYKQRLFSSFSLILLTLTFWFFPVKFTLGMGQINIFILLCLALGLYYFVKGKDKLTGVFLGLSLAIKYFPLFIIFYLILRKKWKILQYLCLTILSLLAVGYLFIDTSINNYFFLHIFPSLFQSTGSYYYNQALSGVVARAFDDRSVEFIVKVILSLVILFITFFVMFKKKKVNKEIILFEIGIIVTTNLLLNSFTWQHHFTWLLIPLIFTAVIIRKKSEYMMLLLIFLLLTFNIKNPANVPILFQSHAFYGALLLWVFDLYLLHKANFNIISKN
jgi:hypothetical protein